MSHVVATFSLPGIGNVWAWLQEHPEVKSALFALVAALGVHLFGKGFKRVWRYFFPAKATAAQKITGAYVDVQRTMKQALARLENMDARVRNAEEMADLASVSSSNYANGAVAQDAKKAAKRAEAAYQKAVDAERSLATRAKNEDVVLNLQRIEEIESVMNANGPKIESVVKEIRGEIKGLFNLFESQQRKANDVCERVGKVKASQAALRDFVNDAATDASKTFEGHLARIEDLEELVMHDPEDDEEKKTPKSMQLGDLEQKIQQLGRDIERFENAQRGRDNIDTIRAMGDVMERLQAQSKEV